MKDQKNPLVPIVLLAAGASQRHSAYKLLVDLDGSTLLDNTIQSCQGFDHSAIILVTGAHVDQVRSKIRNYELIEVFNEDWLAGMGKSIAVGIEAVTKNYPEARAAMISVCDQAYFDRHVVASLLEKYESNPASIVISQYRTGKGPPCIFPRKYFDDLMLLHTDHGAASVVAENQESVVLCEFEHGNIDLDSDEDFVSYLTKKKQ